MTQEILDQIKQYGVTVNYEGDMLIFTGSAKAVHAADYLMDKVIPTIYCRSLFCVNYEDDRATRLYRRVN